MTRAVGIRELKARLSSYIQRVKDGETVIITERGKIVGRMLPARASVEDRIHDVVRSGAAWWSGHALKPAAPVARLRRSATTVADLVTENRD